jgi:23S rRNA (adenine2503-C2)-methyltransferase
VDSLQERLRSLGAKPVHARRILANWLGGRALDARATRGDAALPAPLQRAIPALEQEWDRLACVDSAHAGADGSERLLVRLVDGRSVETVRLPSGSLCVSSQVGCAVGCTFCMTGREGLARQLESREIVAQVALARRRGPVKRVVFMGMGEPAHNLDRVMDAIDALTSFGALGRKDVVISSVGDRRLFERLRDSRTKPALALSLHTTDAALRRQLLPRAPDIGPDELVELADEYARSSGIPTQYQWTLLAGVNDGDDELLGIERLIAGRYGVVNFIPWNAIDGSPYLRPELGRMRAMSQWLHQRGILAKLRRSAGQDVEGACGQLRARARAGSR